MSLTRKFLESLGVPEAAVQPILDEHTAVAGRINAELETAKREGAKLADVQKELDALRAEDFQGRYEAEQKAHEALKTRVAEEKARAAKESALREYYRGKGITGANLGIAMRGTRLEEIALGEDGKIADTKDLDALVEGDFKPLTGGTHRVASGGSLQGGNEKPPSANDVMNRLIRGI